MYGPDDEPKLSFDDESPITLMKIFSNRSKNWISISSNLELTKVKHVANTNGGRTLEL